MDRRLMHRYAAAGALAAVVWRAVEPLLRRIFGHPYSDPELITAFVATGRTRRVLDYVVQATGGVLFGSLFARFGGRTSRQAVATAMVENTALFPLLPVMDRYHPEVRSGNWPPLSRSPRAVAVSYSGHILFGLLLGWLARPGVVGGVDGDMGGMARTEIDIAAAPEAVWSVLAEPGSYGDWVVGTDHIARADAAWPEVGSALEYRIGVGPAKLGDRTSVVEADPPRRLVLRAEVQRLGAYLVTLELEPAGAGTHVVMEEGPIEGIVDALHTRLSDVALRRRNDVALRRLKRLAEERT
jgi:uncharacterized protein YndB with AHSA1/START domain